MHPCMDTHNHAWTHTTTGSLGHVGQVTA